MIRWPGRKMWFVVRQREAVGAAARRARSACGALEALAVAAAEDLHRDHELIAAELGMRGALRRDRRRSASRPSRASCRWWRRRGSRATSPLIVTGVGRAARCRRSARRGGRRTGRWSSTSQVRHGSRSASSPAAARTAPAWPDRRRTRRSAGAVAPRRVEARARRRAAGRAAALRGAAAGAGERPAPGTRHAFVAGVEGDHRRRRPPAARRPSGAGPRTAAARRGGTQRRCRRASAAGRAWSPRRCCWPWRHGPTTRKFMSLRVSFASSAA